MNKSIFLSLFLLFSGLVFSQQTVVTGVIVQDADEQPIPDVDLSIEGAVLKTSTNNKGVFKFDNPELPLGEQVLLVDKEGYVSKRYPIIINEGETLDLGTLYLKVDISEETEQIGVISLSDNELAGDDNVLFNVSGLLQSTRDVFLRAAAFDFSATFFNPRGYDNARGKVLINGMEMNKFSTGRPQWTQWGGLNDIQRNRTLSMNTHANEFQFGDLAGTTNIDMRASGQRKGGRVSYASSNRSYQGRVMGSYNSGILSGGWSYSVLMSRRFGDEGFQDATLYDANSFSASVEKQFNDKHSLNFTGFYTPNRRGLSNAITREVEDLKGRRYNPEWGYQNGEKRNVRIRTIEQPVFMLNHYWDINENISLNTNAGYQFGTLGTTRVDNGGTRRVQGPNGEDTFIGGARNPSPVYWQSLPSFFLQDPNPTTTDLANAFTAQQAFLEDGQFDWDAVYEANLNNAVNGGNSTYILKEDLVDDDMFQFNSILNAKLNEKITLNASVDYRSLNSENYAEVADLLGGQQFLDVDFFADESTQAIGDAVDVAQSDLRNPNRLVVEGDRYEYNYEVDVEEYNAFAQAQFQYDWVDFYVAGKFGQTTYQRTGLFENGYYPGEQSFGEGEELEFDNLAAKLGGVFKIKGGHYIDVNAAYIEKAPTLRNSYSNPRQNHMIVEDLKEVLSTSADLSYIYRSPIIQARLTGYYAKIEDETNVGFYFTEDLTGFNSDNASAFVQEVMSGIDRQHLGAELGIEAQVTPTIKLKAAGAWGQHTYDSNPNLYLTSQDFGTQKIRFGDGKTALKDLKVPGGPQQAYQLGFEYRDPNFWNIGITSNYYSNAYVSPSGLVRSDNFRLDLDGQEFANFDPDIARQTLKQEEFEDYFLFNAIGGKSWKVGDYFVGFFAVINNIFGEDYITGGFEQSRRANFQNRTEDLNRDTPLFGNRYFFGRGTTYYLNFYVRF
ncbi:TonB-dependent receptor [Flavobacteriaceae bacterium 14752]|uniref:TonB-dependent receptor n=1 Tax=Mesohalobacter salilacus TaxID=2491711 RepID=UPI000F6360E1|nr:TonB-dependent receptor [Flavobacteriaceae bacterium 14752]